MTGFGLVVERDKYVDAKRMKCQECHDVFMTMANTIIIHLYNKCTDRPTCI